MRVEVVYATSMQQDLVALDLPSGVSALTAILASQVLERHPEIELEHAKIGVFGKIVAPDTPLADGDRVELYRPMTVDPKLARSVRARRR